MIELVWKQEQLESQEPQILEEFTDYDIIKLLVDTTQYITKYQVWAELEKLVTMAPIKDRRNTLEYVAQKIKLALGS